MINYFYISFYYKMNKGTRKCNDCDTIITIIPRRPRCIDCYKKKLNITNAKKNEGKTSLDLFIPDDE